MPTVQTRQNLSKIKSIFPKIERLHKKLYLCNIEQWIEIIQMNIFIYQKDYF